MTYMGEIEWGSGREVQEGGDIGIHIADSLHCTAEANTTLWNNYTPIKKMNGLKKCGIYIQLKI